MYITLEGTEGSGKSTLINKLNKYFIDKGINSCVFREPGGTPLAEQIRRLLLSNEHNEDIDPRTELLLFYAARMQNFTVNILPNLNKNIVCISDRGVDASWAYQIYGRGIEERYIETLNNTFIPKWPDLTLWLDLPIEIGMERAKKRGELDRFEMEKIEFFKRVRTGYQVLYQREPNRIYRIDASKNPDEILEQAIAIIEQYQRQKIE